MFHMYNIFTYFLLGLLSDSQPVIHDVSVDEMPQLRRHDDTSGNDNLINLILIIFEK